MRSMSSPPAALALTLASLLAAGPAALAAEPEKAAPAALRALVVTGGHDFDPAFWDVFQVPGLEVRKVDQAATGKSFLAGEVKGFDAIVLYDMWPKIADEEKAKLVGLLEAGQGLVVLHHAMADYPDWPEFGRIAGGKFFLKPTFWEGKDWKTSEYKHGVKIPVRVEDPRHPVTRGIGDFEIEDETYKGYWVDPAAHVLLSTSEPTSERAIAWARTHGKARVVYVQLGHGGPRGQANAFTSPVYKRLVSQAIRWVAGKEGQGPVALFNGRDLTGWERRGGAVWTVEDGVLVGKQGPGNSPGDLFTTAEYGDFELQVTYQVVWPANSGVWFRFVSDQKTYQADILEWPDPRCFSGTIYCPGKMFIGRMNTDPATVHREGWNVMVVRAEGGRLEVALNGKKVAEAVDGLSASGKIGFQVHPGEEFGPMRIRVKEALLTPLEK